MDQRQRKQFGSAGNLTIKGITPQKTASRRTTSTTTTKTTLRKSGSIGNIRNVVTSSTPSIKTPPKEKRRCPYRQSNLEQSAIHLQEQYTRQLQQQIYLLELENNYLKHNSGKVSVKNDENDDSYTSDISSLPILTTNLDMTQKREICKIDIPEDDKEKPWRVRKRVSYAQPEVTETSIPSNNYDIKPSSYTIEQAELLHKLEESYQRERNLDERLKQKTTEIERIAYENTQLLEYIEELKMKLQKCEENFARDKRALMEEVVELQRRLDYLTPALADKESHVAKMEIEKDELADKLRHATNQLSEIQIRIDEKSREDRALVDVEEERKNEIDRLLKTIRYLENTIKEMENKETSMINDITAMKRSLREEQLTAKKDKAVAEKALEENSALIKENSHLSAEITRLEMRVKTFNQFTQENDMTPTEIASLRESEKSLKAELLKAEERLQTEKERGRRVIAELEQYRKAEESIRESRGRVQKELDALKALSESLSNENKSLRQEKFSLAERCEELLKKMNERAKEASSQKKEVEYLQEQNRELMRKIKGRENELQRCKEYYENIERQYKETFEELEKQTAMQQEKSEEYEKLAKRVLELSDSVKDKKPTSSNATVRSSKLPTPWCDKSFLDQPSSTAESSANIQQTNKRIQINERKIP
ncbi:Laminin-like protein [Dirofilaria immitis]